MLNALGHPSQPSGLCLAKVLQYCGPPVSIILRTVSLKSYSGWLEDITRAALSPSTHTLAIDRPARHMS